MIDLPVQAGLPGFRAVSLNGAALPLGHVLQLDAFTVSRHIFAPHPHAGFGVVTWVMPDAKGSVRNRDSLGNDLRVTPGNLHWTEAGAGLLHEELPAEEGVPVDGLQVFVKAPEAEELHPPRIHNLAPDAVPRWRDGGVDARVLVGALGGVVSPIPTSTGTMLAHVDVDGAGELPVPSGVDAFAMVLRGQGSVGDAAVRPSTGMALAPGATALRGEGLRLIVGWSQRMPSTPIFQGPFCFFSRDRMADAVHRFRAGGMGQLTASAAPRVR